MSASSSSSPLTRLLLLPLHRRLSLLPRPSCHPPIVSRRTTLAASSPRLLSTTVTFRAMAGEFKVKGVSSLDIKPNGVQEVELEGIEEGKVLLVNSGGKVHALSSKCTHFGAPMKLGVVHNGRITCPWHGACFKVATGDVEDAPALDPLAKFDVVEKNGAVFIRGDEKVIKASRGTANHACPAASKEESVVVVGGGSATIGLLQGLRENDFKGAITVIHKEPYLPIDRTKLSKALIDDPSKLALRGQDWFDAASIKTVQDEVTSIDFKSKTVHHKSGSTPYTKLVLASGGTPRRLPLQGFKGDLGNVFTLRFVTDAKAINQAVEASKNKNVVIIGSSFIGLEAANALKGSNVSVVGMEKTPLERVMGPKVGAIAQTLIGKSGAKFYLGASVDKAVPSEADPSKVGAVLLGDGTRLPADVVVLGVGVAPATEYLRDNSALQLLKDGSLATDELFRVQGVDDVFAVGDIATYPYHGPGGDGKPVRIEHWNVAQNSGRNVGLVIAKQGRAKPDSFIPIFWSALGSQLRYAGNTVHGYDDVIFDGSEEEAKFAAYYTKGDQVVAVATMGRDPIMVQVAELMRHGRMLSTTDLKAGKDPLQVPVQA